MGAAAIFARFALTGASPLAISAARLCIAALLLLAFAASRRAPSAGAISFRARIVLACAGAALATHFATWIGSLDYTPVAISTLLVSTTPLWTALYDAFVRKRPLPPLAIGAFVAGAAGLAAFVGFDTTPPPYPGAPLLGDALAIAGAIAFAAYLLLVRTVRDALATRTIVTHTYTWAALLLVSAALLARQPLPPPGNTLAWGGIVAMALVSQLLGHTAINASLRWFSPSAIAFTTLLEPVFAAILALVIFGERLAPGALAGAILLLASIGTVLWTEPKRELA